MLHALFVVIHVIVCLALSGVVLLQSSKGGGLAGAFGGAGGSPQQMLGSRGMTTLLHKATIYLAVAFFVTSFALFMTQDTGVPGRSGSIMQDAAESGDVQVPIQAPLEQPVENAPAGDDGGDAGGNAGGGNAGGGGH